MEKISEKLLYQGNWVSLKEAEFATEDGAHHNWEIVERKNQTMGVVIVAKLVPSNRYIFIRQYRQPLEGYIIGFPAGLTENDNLAENAERELLEETGYYGKILEVGPLVRSNPGLMTDGNYPVKAIIDENDPRNQHPVQHLENSEEIEVFLVPENETRDFLLKRYAAGDCLGVGIWYAFGFNKD